MNEGKRKQGGPEKGLMCSESFSDEKKAKYNNTQSNQEKIFMQNANIKYFALIIAHKGE